MKVSTLHCLSLSWLSSCYSQLLSIFVLDLTKYIHFLCLARVPETCWKIIQLHVIGATTNSRSWSFTYKNLFSRYQAPCKAEGEQHCWELDGNRKVRDRKAYGMSSDSSMPPLIPDLAECFIHIDSLNQKIFHQHLLCTRTYFRLWRYIGEKGRPESLCSLESESVSHSSCVSLCNSMDCSLPGSSVDGILQARILEWVAIPFSRVSSLTQASNPGLPHCWQILYHLGTPSYILAIRKWQLENKSEEKK